MTPLLGHGFFSLKTLKALGASQFHGEGLWVVMENPQTIKRWMNHAWDFPDVGWGREEVLGRLLLHPLPKYTGECWEEGTTLAEAGL